MKVGQAAYQETWPVVSWLVVIWQGTTAVLLHANWQTPTITNAAEKHSNAQSRNTYVIPYIPILAFYWQFNYDFTYSSVVCAQQKYIGADQNIRTFWTKAKYWNNWFEAGFCLGCAAVAELLSCISSLLASKRLSFWINSLSAPQPSGFQHFHPNPLHTQVQITGVCSSSR